MEAQMRENSPPLRQRYSGKHQSGEKHKQTYNNSHTNRHIRANHACMCVCVFCIQFVWLFCRVAVVVGVEKLLVLMFGLCCGVGVAVDYGSRWHFFFNNHRCCCVHRNNIRFSVIVLFLVLALMVFQFQFLFFGFGILLCLCVFSCDFYIYSALLFSFCFNIFSQSSAHLQRKWLVSSFLLFLEQFITLVC